MAAYTAFLRIIINYVPGNTPSQQVITKQYDNPQSFISEVEDLTNALNDRLAVIDNEFGDVDSYTVTEKVNGTILSVEHVSYDSRLNFMVRHSA
jgi:hypothetical protein